MKVDAKQSLLMTWEPTGQPLGEANITSKKNIHDYIALNLQRAFGQEVPNFLGNLKI